MTKLYKILDTETGLWSCGGQFPVRFNTKGKSWNGTGPLRNHLKHANPQPTWMIVEFIQSEDEAGRMPVSEFINSPEQKAKEKRKQECIKRHMQAGLKRQRDYLINQLNDIESRLK